MTCYLLKLQNIDYRLQAVVQNRAQPGNFRPRGKFNFEPVTRTGFELWPGNRPRRGIPEKHSLYPCFLQIPEPGAQPGFSNSQPGNRLETRKPGPLPSPGSKYFKSEVFFIF